MRKLSTREQMAYRTIATLELERDAALGHEKSERLRGDVAVADCNDAERREAALREELRKWKETSWRHSQDRDALQQRLTAAEQRAAYLKKLLCDVINEAPTGFAALKVDLAHRVNYALKPVQVGGAP